MRNSLHIIALGMLVISCGTTQKPVQKVAAKPVPKPTTTAPVKTSVQTPIKPQMDNQGSNHFYKVNIADASKGDNTISYGSVVSANPGRYKVVHSFFPSVGQNFRQRYIILHYTALDHDKSVRVLTEQSVSSHYLVNDTDDREIYQLVDENKRAYHAGISEWRKITNLNDTSIGIEIVNPGYTADAQGVKTFYDYPEWQFKKVGELVKDLVKRYDIKPQNVIAHSDIAPTRKEDPGPKFPWKRLYNEYGVGMWYDDASKMAFMNQMTPETFALESANSTFIFKYQTFLNDFGYGIMPSGTYDNATKRTIEAFQYHFRPEKYDGIMDLETWAILQALLQKYPAK
ncbi:N-acetylmuramoyl-L-alanine amidase [Chryseobacterium taklimakanense]|uniref:N-acetylmuramoyl-L-alanine amidase n=1 Tax=Chryseobacterium taklimakanense TaxID=536441 RepID=A0A3G8WHR6_9FLAO|nr:N-acetylmuramoyl-L-alanine amidase [Chryseobacterium taklimakanense]AZI20722.1 N-acetylmuramoyl-L-alanine amidase [Chryseobacterium taklimakanense]